MESSTSPTAGAVAPTVPEVIFSLGSLYSYLAQIADQRKRRGIRYPLATILGLVVPPRVRGSTDWRSCVVKTSRLASRTGRNNGGPFWSTL